MTANNAIANADANLKAKYGVDRYRVPARCRTRNTIRRRDSVCLHCAIEEKRK
jgi:hypothetical protein